MDYISQSLLFNSSNIVFDTDSYVMMDWEDSLMSSSAAYICEGGGDILEIGFGMAISANYIQSHSINSHTIIENHPDIIPKAHAWALGKTNVTIVEGSWYDIKDTLSTYDGLFMDTYGDGDMEYFNPILPSLMKSGGKATWWNSMTGSDNYYNISNVTYDIYDVSPPPNQYFNHNRYFLPKKQF
jgi:protein arginine N-methyltransferase 2